MRRLLALLALASVSACTEPPFQSELVLAFPPLSIGAGEESDTLCQSLTLENADRLWVNSVVMDAGPAWHHANWFYVPEDFYDGPDGTWPCNARGFDAIQAGAVGGVFFAQSTQVTHDEQIFPVGAAFSIPPRYKIVGETHLVNASGDDIDTAITLTATLLRSSDVSTRLKPMSLIYQDLLLPPHADTRLTADCPTDGDYIFDFDVYYVLPHYHGLGTGFSLSMHGGTISDTTVYETSATIGQRLGGTVDPPITVAGGDAVRFSCDFTNTGDAPVPWGNRDGEMCMFLAYTDSEYTWAGGVFSGNAVTGTAGDGTILQSGPCGVARL